MQLVALLKNGHLSINIQFVLKQSVELTVELLSKFGHSTPEDEEPSYFRCNPCPDEFIHREQLHCK